MMNYMEVVSKDLVYAEHERLWRLFRKRYQKAQGVADLWASLLEACYYYAVPYRNRFYRPKEQQGEFKATRLYDTTAVEATKTFVSKLQNAMTPPQVQWGYLEIDETFNDLEEIDKNNIQEVLDNYMRRLFVYIHESNFDVVINECYFDLAIGTSCLVINSFTDQQPLLFTSVPMDKLSIEEAFTGRVESWYRYWEDVKINEIQVRWPNARLTPEMMMMVIENPDAICRCLKEGVMYMPHRDKPYVYMVGTEECPLLCEEFESNPGIVWRFQKVNSEVFGRGPVMDALPSIISLNELARIELAAANLNTFKPYMGFSDAVFNPHTFKLEPFTVIPIAPIGSGAQAPLIPLPGSADPNFSQLTIQDLRNQIKTLLFNDVNPNESVQPQTATESMIVQQNLAQRIGPLFSRLQQEFLWPVIKRCAYILDRRGILPIPQIKGVKINFRYRSPLSLAKAEQDIARFTRYFQLMQGLYGEGPALTYVNSGLAPFLMAEQMQVDMRYLNSPQDVIKAAQIAQNQQDAMMASAQQGQQDEEAAQAEQAVQGGQA
jgi:hypothetical protein